MVFIDKLFMKNILLEFEEKDRHDKVIKYINKIANVYKPKQVDKVLFNYAFYAENHIFVYITYFVEDADKIKEFTKITDDLMDKWTKLLKKELKSLEEALGLKIQVWGTDIVDSKSDL